MADSNESKNRARPISTNAATLEDIPDSPGYSTLHNQSSHDSGSGAAYKERIVELNRASIDGKSPFKINSISTTKYTLPTFWPKFLFEQFRKAPNAFFFVVALLQQIPGLSPTGRFTTAVPLGIIMLLTVIKEVVEDWGRMRTDQRVNNSRTKLLRHADWQEAKWKQLQVGDMIRVESNCLLPADILLLSSSEAKGICYIETANLDGETNLKVRQALPATASFTEPHQLMTLQGQLVCEPPNDDTSKFKGSLLLHQDGGSERLSVSLNQLLMRGTCLRKTGFVIGLVVYTGPDTKVMKNSKSVPLKRSRVEQESNRYFLLLMAILAFLTLFTSIANAVWTGTAGTVAWYIPENVLSISHFGSMLITAFITFHTIVPISLQVTLEFMRIFQAYFIECDLDMYDEDSDIAAEARTSSLNEELGQINFVFSDKTGTLTQNCMVFQGATVAGRVYGEVSTNSETGALQFKSGVGAIRQLVDSGSVTPELDLFLTVLAVCHTVIPEKAADGSVADYSASSPDEAALVVAAKSAGYELCDRSLDTFVTIKAAGQERTYKTLANFEFNSDRKRMSMVVQCPDGSIRLFIKGADSAIYPRLGSERHTVETSAHMEKFAVAGLRTLCIATARIEAKQWEKLEAEYQRACNDVENRERLLADVAEKIESNLELLGATAIEDKLQVGVPATINDLLLAGIKIWVLTGDKLETAINIGYSCRLLQSGVMDVRTLSGSGLDLIRSRVAVLQSWVAGLEGTAKEPALVVEGEALAWAGRPELRAEFLEVCLQCRTVICCRVSPKQKSDVVRYVREALPTAVTLAIGDGANDVPMIQESHVGVGLKGKEGLQAAAASDYSLAQFRFLKKLLFVHGAWSYHRVTIVILFSFYKNLTLYITSFWFAMASGFSGQVMFEKWTQGLYNVFFTGATPFALGIFDRSCSQQNCMKYPQLYKETQGNSRYNFKVFALWMLNGVYHSAVIFGCVALALWHGSVFPNGQVSGLYYLGSTVYSLAVVTVALKAGIEHTAWTWLSHFAIWGSVANYFVFVLISANLYPHVGTNFEEVVGFDWALFSSANFWFLVLLTPLLALTRDLAWTAYRRTCAKTLREEVMEMEKLQQDPSGVLLRNTYKRMTETARLIVRPFRRRPQVPVSASVAENIDQMSAGANNRTGYAFSCDDHPTVSPAQLLKSTCPDRGSDVE